MPDPRILFLLDAKNQASKEFALVKKDLAGVEASATKAGGGLGATAKGLLSSRLGMIGVAGVVGGVVLGLKEAASAAMDEERNVARMTAALRENAAGWDGNVDAIEKVIAEREKLAFSDDDLRGSLALLVSVTKDSTKALDLQATAMDLARLRNMDLEAASDLVGKVYGGNIGILSRYGIQLRRGATATEALAEIQRRAAGQAQTYADTTSGTFESLGFVVGDLVEDFGSFLLPALKDLATFARDELIPTLRSVASGLGDILRGANELLEPLGGVQGVLEGIAGAIPGVAAFNLAKKLEEEAKASLAAAAEIPPAIRTGFLSKASVVTDAVDEVAADVPHRIRGWRPSIRDAGRDQVEAYGEGIREGWDTAQSAWSSLKDAIKDPMSAAKRIAKLEGQLSSAKLAEGLNSNDPLIRAAAQEFVKVANDELIKLKGSAYTYGTGTAKQYAKGIREATGSVVTAALALSTKVSNILKLSSPAKEGPLSEAGGPEGWGARGALLYAGGWSRAIPALERIFDGLGSVSMPGLGGAVSGSARGGIAAAGAGAGFGGAPVSIPVYLDGREIARVVDEHLYYWRSSAPR